MLKVLQVLLGDSFLGQDYLPASYSAGGVREGQKEQLPECPTCGHTSRYHISSSNLPGSGYAPSTNQKMKVREGQGLVPGDGW